MKKVFVSGCYDLLHSGHVEFFRQASRFSESPIYNKVENGLMGENKRDCLFSSTSSCYALQAVPRGSRDGEPMNMRRATVAHEAGNKCPN